VRRVVVLVPTTTTCTNNNQQRHQQQIVQTLCLLLIRCVDEWCCSPFLSIVSHKMDSHTYYHQPSFFMSLSLFLFRDFPVSLRFLFSLPPSHPHPHIQYRWSWICLDSQNEMGRMDIRNIRPFLFLSIEKRDPIDGDDSLLFLFFWSILSMSSLLLIILYADPHSFFFGWQQLKMERTKKKPKQPTKAIWCCHHITTDYQ